MSGSFLLQHGISLRDTSVKFSRILRQFNASFFAVRENSFGNHSEEAMALVMHTLPAKEVQLLYYYENKHCPNLCFIGRGWLRGVNAIDGQ